MVSAHSKQSCQLLEPDRRCDSDFLLKRPQMKSFLCVLIVIGLSFAAIPSFAADSRNISVNAEEPRRDICRIR